MITPRVSVVMTTYNSERFLASALNSIFEQSCGDFELIVIDDGSTDSSPAIIRSFASQDSRLRCIFLRKNVGAPVAANKGLRIARGQYVARMDSDDLCHRDRLARQISYLDRHSDIFVLGCRSVSIDEWDKKINNAKNEVPFHCGRRLIAHRMAEGEYLIHHPTLMVRKFCFEELGGYREAFSIGEDIDLYARLLDRYGTIFENLSERLYSYRRYKKSLTNQYDFSQHAWAQTLVMHSAGCRREGLFDPLGKASSLRLSSLPVSSSEYSLLRARYFFHRLYTLPRNKEKRSRLLRRAEVILEKSFCYKDARRFPYPYLQLARASARSGNLFLFLRMLARAWRSDPKRTGRFLLRKIVFLLREAWEGALGLGKELSKRIFCAHKKFATTSPRVSVVMTTYNRARYLSEAIVSWQRQTFSDFELVVVDDGSNDSTKKLLRSFARSDRRIRPVFLPRNYGISYAANRGMEVAQAPLIARADSDDIALPHRLQRQVCYMDLHRRVVLLGSLCGKIVGQNKRVGSKILLRRRDAIARALMQGGVPLVHSSIILRKSYLPQSCYKEFFKLGGEDYDLFLRMMIQTESKMDSCCFDNFPELLMLYREHASRTTRRYSEAIESNHACALFSARRRSQGLSDPLSDNNVVDIESLKKSMTTEECATLEADVAAQKLLSAMSHATVASRNVVGHVRRLRAHSVDKGRFVWVALSAAQQQAKLGFYVRSFLCLWEGLRLSPRWTAVTLCDVVRTRSYDI